VLDPLPQIFVFVLCAVASLGGTLWVYWGVPLRVVANCALGIGIAYAAFNLLLWLGVVQLFGTWPISRIVGGAGFGLGAALGGLLAHVLYAANVPARRSGV
jgi:hypothetical protein